MKNELRDKEADVNLKPLETNEPCPENVVRYLVGNHEFGQELEKFIFKRKFLFQMKKAMAEPRK